MDSDTEVINEVFDENFINQNCLDATTLITQGLEEACIPSRF